MMIIAICVLILNQAWLVTSAAMLIIFLIIGLWFGLTCDIYVGVLVPQLFTTFIVMVCLLYAAERQLKVDFLQLKVNTSLKQDFKEIVEAVPEGILIFSEEEEANKVLIANAEMVRLATAKDTPATP